MPAVPFFPSLSCHIVAVFCPVGSAALLAPYLGYRPCMLGEDMAQRVPTNITSGYSTATGVTQ